MECALTSSLREVLSLPPISLESAGWVPLSALPNSPISELAGCSANIDWSKFIQTEAKIQPN